MALNHVMTEVKSIMRVETPFKDLKTNTIFESSGAEGISHSNSFLFSIFAGSCFIPIPRKKISISYV
jgi:hypothetical protein